MSDFQTSRFVVYLPDSGKTADAEEGHRVSAFFSRRKMKVFSKAAYLFGCDNPEKSDENIPVPPEEGLWGVDLFPGTIAADLGVKISGSSWEDHHRELEKRVQFYQLIRLLPFAFRLESDLFGIKPFYEMKSPHGMLLASRITDLLDIFPEIKRVIAKPFGLVCFSFRRGIRRNRESAAGVSLEQGCDFFAERHIKNAMGGNEGIQAVSPGSEKQISLLADFDEI